MLGYHRGAPDSLGGIFAHPEVLDAIPVPLSRLDASDVQLVAWWPHYLSANNIQPEFDTRPIMYERVVTNGYSPLHDFPAGLVDASDLRLGPHAERFTEFVPEPHCVAQRRSSSTPELVPISSPVPVVRSFVSLSVRRLVYYSNTFLLIDPLQYARTDYVYPLSH